MDEDWRNTFSHGEEKEQENKNAYSGTGTGDKNEQFELASGLYKSCRIGDYKNALRFAEKLKRLTGDFYVMRILTQLCGEDLAPEEYQRLVPTIRTIYHSAKGSDLRGHDLWHCVFAVATAKKWYMTPEGVELEKMRQTLHKGIPVINTPRPNWLFDFHTREGRANIKAGTADLRLDGRWENRFNIQKRWEAMLQAHAGNETEARKQWVKSHYDQSTGDTL